MRSFAALDANVTLTDAIPSPPDAATHNGPSPSKRIMTRALDSLQLQSGLYVAYTPWFGKVSLFGKGFVHFDFYIALGAGMAKYLPGKLPVTNSPCPSVP